jgi:serine/threonine-protein kinase
MARVSVDRSDTDGAAPTAIADEGGAEPRAGAPFAGRYLVERPLGRGGMGAVWAAVDRELGEQVALKVLDAQVARGTQAVERFRREVRLARRVTHRNVARIYDIGEHGGTFYLTMELVRGRSLAELVSSAGRMSPARAIEIARQIADGLSAAHTAGVVHRDLKPGNVLVEDGGRAVITDFGIAFGLVDDIRVTADASALVGTPAYMAPEQVRGGKVDERTDVYALGLVLYEMVTGILPFTAETPLQAAVARLDRRPEDPRQLTALPDDLAELVLACLDSDPERRPASARALIELLDALADAPATVAGVTAPPRQTSATGSDHGAQRLGTGSGPATSRPVTARPATPGTFVSQTSRGQSLAVLPFRYRGPPGDEYVAETIADELVDLLSATRGLKVMASGATTKYAGDRDARTVGSELGVDVVVDGTVQRAGDTLRISARLVDVATGFQTWSGRFDGKLQDVFELQDLVAKKIAETLRVELETGRHRAEAPPEAIELYMRARRLARDSFNGDANVLHEAIGMYDECLALAPEFAPALAARATACLRGWFNPANAPVRNWQQDARAAVAAAVAGAPGLAETQLAVARLAVQDGRYRDAAGALGDALRIAPTYPEAHEYAGSLKCEAGRPEDGIRHLRLAAELDPDSWLGLMVAARHHALHGQLDEYERLMAQVESKQSTYAIAVLGTKLRISAWLGQHERMREVAERMRQLHGPDAGMFGAMAKAYAGEIAPKDAFAMVEQLVKGANPRFRSMIWQFAAESACLQGELELGWHALTSAANDVLVDLDWLEHCPVIEPLRRRDDFSTVRNLVKQRAESIWNVR